MSSMTAKRENGAGLCARSRARVFRVSSATNSYLPETLWLHCVRPSRSAAFRLPAATFVRHRISSLRRSRSAQLRLASRESLLTVWVSQAPAADQRKTQENSWQTDTRKMKSWATLDENRTLL